MRILKKIIRLLLIIFVLFSVLNSSSYNFIDFSGNRTVECPIAPSYDYICEGGVLEHVQEWKNILAIIGAVTILLVMFFFGFSLYSLLITLKLRNNFLLSFSNHFHIPISSTIKELFSGGILNPKIYS